MSSIPPPINTHSSHVAGGDPYGYGTGQAGGSQDPYFGLLGGGGGGEAIQTPEMQAYVQQLYYYHSMYQQMLQTATDPNQINQLRQYDSQVLQYLQQVGAPPPQEGVPFGGDPNALGPEQTPSQYTATPPDYQTKDYVVFEEGASIQATIDRQDPDKREAHYHQPTGVLNIPSNAAAVKVTLQPDDAMEGNRMAIVEITLKNPDGSSETRKVVLHGIDREGFQWAINTPSEEQLDLSAVTSDDDLEKIQWGQSAQPEQLLGDPPTDMEGDTRIYDGQNFNISPVPTGDDEATTVMASGDVTYTPNSNTEYATVELDAATGNYLIKVYKEGPPASDLKETITVKGDLVNNINFAVDPTRIEFLGDLGKGDGHNINENSEAGAKLHLTGEESAGLQEGQPMNPESPADTPVDQLSEDGNEATFNSSENVELTNYPPPNGPDTVNITAPGEVIIHKNSFDDTVTVSGNATDGFTIVVKDAETNKETTYKVKGPPTNIVLDFLPENISGSAEYDALIQQGTTPIDAAQMLTDLAGVTGKTEQQITTAILGTYPEVDTDGNQQLSTEEINAAKGAGIFPPLIPDGKFVKFLYDLDPGLKSLLDDFKGADSHQRELIIGPLRDRLVSLLGKFYSSVTPSGTENIQEDNLRIGSAEYDFITPLINGDGAAGTGWVDTAFSGEPWELLDFKTQEAQ